MFVSLKSYIIISSPFTVGSEQTAELGWQTVGWQETRALVYKQEGTALWPMAIRKSLFHHGSMLHSSKHILMWPCDPSKSAFMKERIYSNMHNRGVSIMEGEAI